MQIHVIGIDQAQRRTANRVTITTMFGQTLRQRRLDVDMSRTTLAELAGCDQTFIGLLERDARAPSRATVLTLATALGLNTSQTDRLLRDAGYASQVDYQELWERLHGAVEDRTKWCWACQSMLPVARFSRDRTRYDGLLERCKTCDAARRKAFRTRAALRGRSRRAS